MHGRNSHIKLIVCIQTFPLPKKKALFYSQTTMTAGSYLNAESNTMLEFSYKLYSLVTCMSWCILAGSVNLCHCIASSRAHKNGWLE